MVKRKYSRKPQAEVEMAKERINVLFKQAEIEFDNDPKLSNRYVDLARRISMKTKVRIPSELKRRFCKHCYGYFRQGENCRVRVNDGKVIYYCLNCKKYMRFLIKLK
jgi:ribonuclease P protein subunit RPR2